MTTREEVLVFGCRDDDVALLNSAFGSEGPALRIVDNADEFARDAVSRGPLAILLGVGEHSIAHLDLIPLIRAMRSELPVIVIAEEDSLELERRARQKDIFYYLVHPVDRSEARAVLADALRYSRDRAV
jgi:DNA-binding NtrC family response regulator